MENRQNKTYKTFDEIKECFKDSKNHPDIATFLLSKMVDRLWLTIKAADLDCSLEQLDEFGYAYGFKGVWKPCAGPAGTTEYIAALAHPFEMGYRERPL